MADQRTPSTASSLAEMRCEPCNERTPKVPRAEATRLAAEIPEWTLEDDRLVRDWTLRDFKEALGLLDEIGRVAEAEDHHPDLHLTGYKHLRVELSTHAIGGLSHNDFVLAAKIDRIAPKKARPADRGSRPARRAAT